MGGARRRQRGPSLCHPPREPCGSSTPPPSLLSAHLSSSAPSLPLPAVRPSLCSLRAAAPGTSDSSPRRARRRRPEPPPRAMEPAAGSERRSAPVPAVPAPPRGHAPLAAAPGPGPLSNPAREPPKPEEERQLRISESGQFSDGLEDRGERTPPWPLAGAAPFPLSRRGEEPPLPARLYPLAGWRGAGRGARRLGARGGAGPGLPREGAERGAPQPHLLRPAPPGQPLLTRSARTGQPPGGPRAGPCSPLSQPRPSGAQWKSSREAFFAFGAQCSRGTADPAQLGGTRAQCVLLPSPLRPPAAPRENFLLRV